MKILTILSIITIGLTKAKSIHNERSMKILYPSCNENMQEGYHKLEEPEEFKNVATIGSTSVKIIKFEDHINIIAFKRRRYTRKELTITPGGWLETKEENVPINIETARRYAKNGECRTGYECKPGGDCWGNGASKCDSSSLHHPLGPTSMKWRGESYKVALRESCISSWECTLKSVRIPVYIEIKDGKIIRKFLTPDKDVVVINKDFYIQGFKSSTDFQYFPVYDTEKKDTKLLNATCYSTDPKTIKCAIEYERSIVGVNIDPLSFIGVYRGAAITVLSPVTTIRDGKVIKITSGQTEHSLDESKPNVDDSQRSTSIESLQEVIDSVQIIQMQAISNVMENRVAISQLSRVVIRMIKRLSKNDPFLISKTLNENFKTKWINEDTFTYYRCNEPFDFPPTDNCIGPAFYYHGAIVEKPPDFTQCMSVDSREIKAIHIINSSFEMDTRKIDFKPPQTSSSDDSNWDWLVKERLKSVDYNNDHSDDHISHFSVQSLEPVFWSWKNIALYFSTFTALLTWLSVLLSLHNRL